VSRIKKSVKAIRERTIEVALVEAVQALGGICEKVQVIGKRGWPDRLCILPGGLIILAEIKRPYGGRLSPHQQQYRNKLAALGIAVAVIRNQADIDRLLSSVRKKTRGPRNAVNDRGPRMSTHNTQTETEG
jgi:hypothetical protein